MTALILWRRLTRPFRRPKRRTVTITLTLDDRGFTDGMLRSSDAIKELEAQRRHRVRIARERILGRAYVQKLTDDWRAELGMPNAPVDDDFLVGDLRLGGMIRALPCDCDICYDGELEQ